MAAQLTWEIREATSLELGVRSTLEQTVMENKEHINVFEDVHKKIQAHKDRLREANAVDTERREKKTLQAAADAFEKKF
jgi:hypothetical protein